MARRRPSRERGREGASGPRSRPVSAATPYRSSEAPPRLAAADPETTPIAWWPPWIGTALVLAIGVNYVIRLQPAGLPDDAYYYFVIARNIAAGLGSTFDQIEPTNGYQPLWMCFLVPIFWLAGGADDLPLRIVSGLCFVLTAATVWLFVRIALEQRLHAVVCAAAGVGVAIGLTFDHLPGLETQLVQLLAVACAWYLVFRPRRPFWLLGGLLVGGLLLSRLDNGLVVGSVLLVGGIVRLASRSWRAGFWESATYYAKVLAIGAVVLAAYLTFNQLVFGDPLPISSRIKTRPLPLWRGFFKTWSNHYYHNFYWVAAVGACSMIVWLIWRLAPGKRTARAGAMALGIVAVGGVLYELLHIAYQQLFGVWGLQFSWHYPFETLVLALCGLWIASLGRAVTWGLLCLVPLGFVVASNVMVKPEDTIDPRPTDNWVLRQIEAGRWARDNLPEGAGVALSDCGAFSYFSRRRVLNLDGLTAGEGFHRAVGDGTIGEYLQKHRIDFLGHHVYRDADCNAGVHINFAWRFAKDPRVNVNSGHYEVMHFFFYSRLHPEVAWRTPLTPAQQVFQSETFDHGTARVHLWWIQHPIRLGKVKIRQRPPEPAPGPGLLGRDR